VCKKGSERRKKDKKEGVKKGMKVLGGGDGEGTSRVNERKRDGEGKKKRRRNWGEGRYLYPQDGC
jgi:hypothetical protein